MDGKNIIGDQIRIAIENLSVASLFKLILDLQRFCRNVPPSNVYGITFSKVF
jgi:hypothetical protein